MENGETEKCMERGNLSGKMGQAMMEIISTIRSMGKGVSFFRQETTTKVIGKMGSNMERGSCSIINRKRSKEEYGRTVSSLVIYEYEQSGII